MATILVALVLVAGLSYLAIKKRKKSSKVTGTAVPISDPEEIKALKKNFSALPKKKLTNSQLIQMAQAQQAPPTPSPKAAAAASFPEQKPEVPELHTQMAERVKAAGLQKAQETIERLEAENKQLKDALDRELSSKNAVTLSEEEQQQLAQAKNLGEHAQQSLGQLTVENEELKRQVSAERERFDGLEKKFILFKAEFDHQKSIEWSKEEALQNNILKLREENEKLLQSKEGMERKWEEFNELILYKNEMEGKFRKIEAELSQHKESNRALLSQLKEAQEQARQFKEDLEVAKLTYEQKLAQAADRIMALQGVGESKRESSLDEESKNILEGLRRHNGELKQANEELRAQLQKAQEFNVHLKEKEKILQYELTKARAQSVGLEKICEDFKVHIETLNKAVQRPS
ncbi:MAG TPA: hypothetical protein VI749_03760 [Candidatus Omnitrophota bacterium]|nr:hypothetical protein [Candidatus Omnitrophota bacterium]